MRESSRRGAGGGGGAGHSVLDFSVSGPLPLSAGTCSYIRGCDRND